MPLPMVKEIKKEKKSNIKNIICIAAGKGGVGKSTITVNLAHALKNSGFKVGILDADLYGPSLRQMLPEDKIPIQKGETIIPAISWGIKTISMAFFKNANESSAVRAPIANSIIKQFLENVAWGELDYLLIDFPPGTGDIQLTLCQQGFLTGAVMITTPQLVSLLDVRKAMELFRKVNVPIIGIIENMSYYIVNDSKAYPFGVGGGEHLAAESGVPILGMIPLSPTLCEYSDSGKSLFYTNNSQTECLKTLFLQIKNEVITQIENLSLNQKLYLKEFEFTWKKF
ncbi:Cell division inhibitor MinD [Candidatus Rubidus massiliensis]|nr:Cell division inhibitor MinD [Candidatus Rubidus massiliensis]